MPSEKLSQFAQDVSQSLSENPKWIYEKYLYDEEGSRLFEKITESSYYYVTGAEYEILRTQTSQIAENLNFNGPFNIVELGPGDGLKTEILLRHLLEKNLDITYYPIDISEGALEDLVKHYQKVLPELKIHPLRGDYEDIFKNNHFSNQASLFISFGASCGNLTPNDLIEFVARISKERKPGDKFLIGFDLKTKSPHLIEAAYSGAATAAFDLNILQRLKLELKADINTNDFGYFASYNPISGYVTQYVYSNKKQSFKSEVLDQEFHFQQGETISVGISKKFTVEEIQALATSQGFRININFTDSNNYFVDSLWEK